MSDAELSDRPSPAELAEFEARRRERIIRDGRVRAVECPYPTCLAGIGEDCRSASWYRLAEFHSARRKLAGV